MEAQETSKTTLTKEKDRASNALNQKVEALENLKKSVEQEKKILREKEIDVDELKTKISALKLEISQKKTIYQSKKEEFYRLQQQKIAYEASPSFLDITGTGQIGPTDSFRGNASVSSSDGGSNRISLSREPIKI